MSILLDRTHILFRSHRIQSQKQNITLEITVDNLYSINGHLVFVLSSVSFPFHLVFHDLFSLTYYNFLEDLLELIFESSFGFHFSSIAD